MGENFPKFELTNQVALVTGAGRGLGRAISLALANAGADVALGLYDVNRDSGVADEIRAMGRRALPLQMDVTNLEQVRRAVEDQRCAARGARSWRRIRVCLPGSRRYGRRDG